ncbi:uncharacterized protein LOC125698262 isoform X6 [Lagopus muta]|uniref:uncharacterized protein LOC125698262 isoform X6 n=1 Tax=Lagopus muta TaxID=64668 RepID=UPI0020A1C58F|nr:uncharacterized protein LOC125698262 isoform X6 [Lagopus muta]
MPCLSFQMDLLEQVAGEPPGRPSYLLPLFPPWGRGTCIFCAECEGKGTWVNGEGVGGEVGATRVGDSRCGCHQAGSGFTDPQVSSLLLTLQDKVPPFLQLRYWLRSWLWQVWMEQIKAAQVSSSKQAVAGAASTAAFFLCEGLLGRHFDVVPNGAAEPQPGDLFLFPLASRGPGWWGAHAGVYCGDGEIIHLEGTSGTSPTGIVAKHGKSHLLRTRGPAKVLRMKGGLDAAALQWRIRAAMDMVLDYDAVTCNCIHFALALLGLGQLTGDMMFPALQ